MERLLRRLASLRRADGGTVYAEFIMAFTPFFLLFLGTVQLAFIAASGLVVQTAAVKAVRAATVVLDDDPVFYRGEDRRLLDFNNNSEEDGWMGSVGTELISGGAVWAREDNGNGAPVSQMGNVRGKGGPRLRAIRRAAYMPLSAIGPEWYQLAAWLGGVLNMGGAHQEDRYSLAKTAIGQSPFTRLTTGFLAWNPIAAAVNFPTGPEAEELRNDGEGFTGQLRFDVDDSVTVRVTYLYPCGVPIANLLVCRSLLGMTGIEDTIENIEDLLEEPTLEELLTIDQQVRDIYQQQADALSRAQRNFKELQAGAEHPSFLYGLLFAQGARFHVLRREATLPIQGAPYCYPNECRPPNPNYEE
jgi:hypothetical protein